MNKISFIGGDTRNLELAKMFSNCEEVVTYGFQDLDTNLAECLNCKYIVFPIPLSKDEVSLYAPLSRKKILFEDFIEKIESKTIFGGKFVDSIKQILTQKQNRIIDIGNDKDFIINNAIPTAEGIIKIIIENTDITIDESNIAILGFGNVGKRTAKTLSALGANVFGYDNNKLEVANIKDCGYNVLEDLNNNISKIDVIVNTIPSLIVDKDLFENIKKSTFIVDIASMPGGTDFRYARNNGYKVVHALGLPGIIAPVTSAKYMKNVIEKYIE